MTESDQAHDAQSKRFREAVDRKAEEARMQAEQESLYASDRPQDETDPRAKSSGHKKKTADKWNQ
jgi:hypothetical protein